MAPRHHAVIAGTGRAGTTFLVKYLSACGVPCGDITTLAHHEHARAGLEQSLLSPDASYLVKDPWLDEYLDQIDLSEVKIDALIVPVRSLQQAALSRVRQERASLIDSDQSRMARKSFGTVPGGIRYSLSVVDQERILAVGQANLIEWAMVNEVPLYLLHFRRMVEDPEYLPATLQPWLTQFCDVDQARAVYEQVVSPATWYTKDSTCAGSTSTELESLLVDLRADVEALNLVLTQRNQEIAELNAKCEALIVEKAALRAHAGALAHDLDKFRTSSVELSAMRDSLQTQLAALKESHSFRIGRIGTAPLRLFKRS